MRLKTFRPHLSTASDARAVRTREGLRQALLKLLETTALDQLTIRDIANTAEINYSTFLRHYPTKDALLRDVADGEIERLLKLTLPEMDANHARVASVALFEFVTENQALWSTFLLGGAASAVRESMLTFALKLAAERAPREIWARTELATRLLVGGTIEMLAWWLRLPPQERMSADEAGQLHLRTVVLPAMKSQPSVSAARVRRSAATARS